MSNKKIKQKMYGKLTKENPKGSGKYEPTGESVSLCYDEENKRYILFVNKGDEVKSCILNDALTQEQREKIREFTKQLKAGKV